MPFAPDSPLTPPTGPLRVTVHNFRRAESHHYMGRRAAAGMFGKIFRIKTLGTADDQIVVRMNCDVLFCYAILDLTAPATITLPDPGTRYMSMRVINEDHYIRKLSYAPGPHLLDQALLGTRYAHVAIRFFVDPNDPQDMAQANALQDAVALHQRDAGRFEIPDWDEASRAKVRHALKLLGATQVERSHMFGSQEQTDPVVHLIGTAQGWGGGTPDDSSFQTVYPERNDGQVAYQLEVPARVPVDAFWSVTVYNREGFFQKNARDLYSRNSTTSVPNADGSTTIRFGGDPQAQNYLPICDGWTYSVRMYRPRAEILSGAWKFPSPRPVS